MKNTTATRRAIMRLAWSIYREETADDPAARTRTTWGACLRWAWEQQRDQSAEGAAAAVCREWDAMADAEQLHALRGMARRAAMNFTSAAKSSFPWHAIELDDIANTAYVTMTESLDRLPAANMRRIERMGSPASLSLVLYNAAYAAAMRMIREVARNGSTGEQIDPETPGDSSTERAAILQASLSEIKDPTDRLIFHLVASGDTVRQIAKTLNSSPSSVCRRIKAIRKELEDALTA